LLPLDVCATKITSLSLVLLAAFFVTKSKILSLTSLLLVLWWGLLGVYF